jgi:uroporphyrinogen-III decarboxylase
MVNMHQAIQDLNGLAICGNINPVSIFLQGTPGQVREAVLTNASTGYPFWISAAGCEIPDQTPSENIHAQRQVLRDFSTQGLTTTN